MSSTKYTVLAYVFALLGGLVGLHHLYLGRTQHALLWFTTFGGFGFGLFYELLFAMNLYVREANHDQLLLEQYQQKLRQRKSPAFEFRRFCGLCEISISFPRSISRYQLFSLGQYAVSLFYGFITFYAFPDTWLNRTLPSLVIYLCTIVAIALGNERETIAVAPMLIMGLFRHTASWYPWAPTKFVQVAAARCPARFTLLDLARRWFALVEYRRLSFLLDLRMEGRVEHRIFPEENQSHIIGETTRPEKTSAYCEAMPHFWLRCSRFCCYHNVSALSKPTSGYQRRTSENQRCLS